MRSALLIAWREYKQYIFSRGFLIFLIMFPLSVTFVGATVGYLENAKPARDYVIFDKTGAYADAIEDEINWRHRRSVLAAWDAYVSGLVDQSVLDAEKIPAPFAPAATSRARIRAFENAGLDAAEAAIAPFRKADAPLFTPPRARFHRLDLPPDVASAADVAQAADLLRPYLLGQKPTPGAGKALFAAILIPEGFSTEKDAPAAQFWSRNLTDRALASAVSSALNSALRREKIEKLGVSADALDEISGIEAPLTDYRPDRADGEAELSVKDRIETTLPAAMTYMLLVVIFGVGNLLLTNTIEERSNKIVEVLLSSVTADQLMIGKLIGIAAVGLTMPTIFIVSGVVAALGGGGGAWAGDALSALFGSHLLFVYLFYFVCAYVIYAMIFLAIGAMSNSLQDAQSFMGPLMLVVFLPLPFMLMVYQNPNGVIAQILTWIPIYTPYAVMMRAASDPPLWQIVCATALMIAFAIVLVRAMGRIFRNAILDAQPARAKDLPRLLFSGKR